LDCNKIKYIEPSERTIMKMSRKKRDKKGDKDSDEKLEEILDLPNKIDE